jgi:hypothetical protein
MDLIKKCKDNSYRSAVFTINEYPVYTHSINQIIYPRILEDLVKLREVIRYGKKMAH